MFRAVIAKLAQIAFVHNAIVDGADLRAFKERPTPRIVVGVSVIALSYVMGWPMVALLGALSIYFSRPLLVVIGGPAVYIFSHLLFLLGMYLAGVRYSWIVFRWLTRITMLKLMRWTGVPIPVNVLPERDSSLPDEQTL